MCDWRERPVADARQGGAGVHPHGHKLETGVAMHFWYDFLLSTVAFAADPQNQPFAVPFSMPM